MSNRVNKRISYRDEILAAVREIVNSKGINQFEVGEVVEYMLSKNQNLNPSTIRTHITSRCCVNAPANHPVTYNDYERIKRGVYRLYEPLSSVKDEGRVLTKDKLFFVDINDSNNRLLALDLEIRCEDDGRTRVSFYDTNRGRGFYGEIEYQDPQSKRQTVPTFKL